MKRTILMISAILIGICSYGQLGFGIKGAVNMSSLSGDLKDYSNAAKVGFQAGAFVRIGDKWHLQPEAYFSTKAADFDYGYTPDDGNPIMISQTMTLNTIDVPVLIGYKILDPPMMNLRLQAGPVASFVMNKKFEPTTGGKKLEESNQPIKKDDFNDMNWGIQAGAGVDVLFLTLDVRYEFGLNNLYQKPDGSDLDPNFKNNVFFVSLGWKIL